MICQKLVRLFVDDCLLYRPIRCHQDHVDLQDLNLEKMGRHMVHEIYYNHMLHS